MDEEKAKLRWGRIIIAGLIIIMLGLGISAGIGYSKYRTKVSTSNLPSYNVGNQPLTENALQNLTTTYTDLSGLHDARIKIRNSSGSEVVGIDDKGSIELIGNLTDNSTATGGYGFFAYVGNSVNKVIKGWFTNLQVDQNINSTNVTTSKVVATGEISGNTVTSGGSTVWTQASLANVSQLNNDVPYALNSSLSNYYTKTLANSTFAVLSGGNSFTGQQDFNGGWTSNGASIINGDGYFQNVYAYNFSGLNIATINTNGSILPTLDNQFNIGNSSYRWKNGVFGGDLNASTIYESGSQVWTHNTLVNLSQLTNDVPYALNSTLYTNFIPYTGASSNVDLGTHNLTVGSTSLFVNGNTGNVGIGTTTPKNTLNVVGNLNVTGTSYLGNTVISTDTITVNNVNPLSGGTVSTSGSLSLGGSLYLPNNGGGGPTTTGNGLYIKNSAGTSDLTLYRASGDAVRLSDYGGNSGIYMDLYGSSDSFQVYNASNLKSLFYVGNSNGDVGIGTTTPGYALDVVGSIHATSWLRTDGTNGWYSQTYGGGWFMQDTTWIRSYNSKGVWTNTGLLGSQGGLTLGYGGTSPPSGGAIIAGDVGIGTSSPSQALTVNGNVQLSASGNCIIFASGGKICSA